MSGAVSGDRSAPGIWAPGARGEAPYKTREWDQKVVIYSYYLWLSQRTSGSVGKVRDRETKGRGFESIIRLSILFVFRNTK